MKRKNAFENFEKKLNIASTLIEELQEDVIPDSELIEVDPLLPVENIEEVFNLNLLKQDFMLIRQNLLSLVKKGQHLLDSASILDMTELKASQIEAISNLNSTIANNLNILIDMYKKISEIETKKINKFSEEGQMVQSVNTGTVNNIVFQGTTDQMLQLIKNQQNNS